MKVSTMALGISLFISVFAGASPDHDHGAATVQPTKGGTIQSTHNHHFEMALKGNKVFLYAYSKETEKMISTEGLKVTAKFDNPKTKQKGAELVLTDKKDSWEAEIDWKGSHRITIYAYIDDGKEKDHVRFTFSNK